MSNTNKSASAAKVQPTAVVTEKNGESKMEVVKVATPVVINEALQERLKALNQLNLLNSKREKLISKRAEVNEFELDMDGENDRIILEANGGAEVEIKRPEALKKVLELLKGELQTAIASNESELLAIVA